MIEEGLVMQPIQHECWVGRASLSYNKCTVQFGGKKNQEERSEQELEILYGSSTKRDYQLRGLIGGLSEASSWFFRGGLGAKGRHPSPPQQKRHSKKRERESSSLAPST